MALYNRLDLALDPVGGLCGLTTTCDALWMGLPVLALEGTGLRRRISASILGALGREVWLAPDNNAYVETALALAADTAQRRELRRNLRGEMAASELCDSKGLARALEEAYLMMFDLWRESRGQA